MGLDSPQEREGVSQLYFAAGATLLANAFGTGFIRPAHAFESNDPKLSDGGQEMREFQPRRDAAVRCSARLE